MKMREQSDKLEKLIRENRVSFDEEAPEGHFERFQQRLEKANKLPAKKNRSWYWQAAAAVVIVLLAGNQLRMYFAQPEAAPAEEQVKLQDISTEYGEAELYYTSAIDQGMRHWEKLTEDGFISPKEQSLMQEEIAEFNQTRERLQQDLATNPNDERVINAMLELYQTRLSIIHLIIDKLEDIKNHQTQNEDEPEI